MESIISEIFSSARPGAISVHWDNRNGKRRTRRPRAGARGPQMDAALRQCPNDRLLSWVRHSKRAAVPPGGRSPFLAAAGAQWHSSACICVRASAPYRFRFARISATRALTRRLTSAVGTGSDSGNRIVPFDILVPR